ncbi:MAG: hypothetical protein M1831_006272 [Alyxoria varia]|nr:MAG: hypothetical protein M1831_006272 [Alyxoria varia]
MPAAAVPKGDEGNAKSVTERQFFAIIWALTSLACTFYASRIVIRWKVFKRFMLDDAFVTLALLLLLAVSILLTIESHPTFVQQDVQYFHKEPPTDYKQLADRYTRAQWANAYIFFCGIWTVKGAFLAFYSNLTHNLPTYRKIWWAIVVFTFLTWIGALISYALLFGNIAYKGPKNRAIYYAFSSDIVTDVLITLLPLSLAFKAQFPLKRKLALSALFSLGLITTVFCIIRFAMDEPGKNEYGPTWLQTWSHVEQAVSVMVACLASFRNLVASQDRSSDGQYPAGSDRRNYYAGPHSTASAQSSGAANRVKRLSTHIMRNPTGSHARSESTDIELLASDHSNKFYTRIDDKKSSNDGSPTAMVRPLRQDV